jgi:membrane associated rhomboid family serine protease
MTPASVGFQCPECVAEGRKTVRQARTIYGAALRPTNDRMGSITMTLIVINVVMFVATSVGGFSFASNGGTSHLFQQLSLIPPATAHGQYYRLITAMFLHFSVLHIAFNMYALYLIGPHLEVRLGWWRYLALYFLAGIGGSVLTMLNGPLAEEAAGASGAIFGLFAAFYIMARREHLQTGSIVTTIVLNLALTFSFSNEIDWRGHVGGLIVGAIVMALYAYTPRGPQRHAMQAIGVVAMAAVLAGGALIGNHRVNHACENASSQADVAFCQVYDPSHAPGGV